MTPGADSQSGRCCQDKRVALINALPVTLPLLARCDLLRARRRAMLRPDFSLVLQPTRGPAHAGSSSSPAGDC
eukprot:3872340-Rhodomonas_salina.2